MKEPSEQALKFAISLSQEMEFGKVSIMTMSEMFQKAIDYGGQGKTGRAEAKVAADCARKIGAQKGVNRIPEKGMEVKASLRKNRNTR